jgi:hypothetical protein
MIRASIIGTGIALLCFLPPILHFISGPLSPLIGGYFAALRISEKNPPTKEFLYTGLMTGLILTCSIIIVGIPVYFMVQTVGDSSREVLDSLILLAGMSFGVLLWALSLGLLGGLFAARSSKQRSN